MLLRLLPSVCLGGAILLNVASAAQDHRNIPSHQYHPPHPQAHPYHPQAHPPEEASPLLYALNEIPRIGEVSQLSLLEQRRLGRSWLRKHYSALNPVKDVLLHDYVNKITKRLKQGPDLANYDINIVLLRSADFNAFAVPGGIIGINLGIFLLAESEGEFASVMAHELSHLSQDHFLRRLEYAKSSRATSLGGLFASLALAISGNVPLASAAFFGTLGYQTEDYLRLSRQFETEADNQALVLLANGKFNLQDMPSMLTRLNSYSDQNALAAYRSTHPLTTDRINDALLRVRQKGRAAPSLRSREYDFVRQRASFLAGKAARTGGTAKPTSYTDALHLMDKNKFNEAADVLRKLTEAQPESLMVFYSLLDALIGAGDTAAARRLIADKLKFSVENPVLDYFYALSYAKDGVYPAAISYMNKFAKSYPENPETFLKLASYYEKTNDKYNLLKNRIIYYLLTGRQKTMTISLDLAKQEAGDDPVKQAELENIFLNYN